MPALPPEKRTQALIIRPHEEQKQRGRMKAAALPVHAAFRTGQGDSLLIPQQQISPPA